MSEPSSPNAALPSVNILLVDDQIDNLYFLEKALETEGWNLMQSGSGSDALELSTKHEFALIILDVHMPGMNGLETAKRMRSHPKTRQTPIMFITAYYTEQESIFRGYETGAVDYLSKPVQLDILRSKVRVFVELYQQNKQLEDANQQLQQLNTHLIQANSELKSTHAQLVQAAKMASLGELATGVVHELSQPLFGIGLYTEKLINCVEKNRMNEINPGLHKILKQVERASFIIEHLRTFGRQASALDYYPFDLNQIILNSFILINEQMKMYGIEVHKQLSERLPWIRCNPIQIEQVLSNLLINAQDAMAESGKKQLTIRSSQEEPWVVVELEDTGMGIPAKNLEKIFETFFTTKAPGKGTGIGLSISRQIVESHGGRLSAKSKVDVGTVFRIELPIGQGELETESEA